VNELCMTGDAMQAPDTCQTLSMQFFSVHLGLMHILRSRSHALTGGFLRVGMYEYIAVFRRTLTPPTDWLDLYRQMPLHTMVMSKLCNSGCHLSKKHRMRKPTSHYSCKTTKPPRPKQLQHQFMQYLLYGFKTDLIVDA